VIEKIKVEGLEKSQRWLGLKSKKVVRLNFFCSPPVLGIALTGLPLLKDRFLGGISQ